MKTAIIGAGLMCRRRAPVLKKSDNSELLFIASKEFEDAQELATQFECEALESWQEVISNDDIEAIIVCTPPGVHAEISIAAMKAGKHVLCEKPLTRTVAESEEMLKVAKEFGVTLKCGFNHRHHPAITEGKKLLDKGEIGKPLFARCIYGICGRPDYQTEWRADPNQAAGGQFIEQGTHAIDLFRWFLGDLTKVTCMTSRLFFKDQPLDEGGMAIFQTSSGATASLHTTLTQWKNLFQFEVFGEDGYLTIDGLGASYGVEKLSFGKRDFSGPFTNTVTEFRRGDISWEKEWNEFLESIQEGREPLGNGIDGLEAMKIGLAAYESHRSGQTIYLS